MGIFRACFSARDVTRPGYSESPYVKSGNLLKFPSEGTGSCVTSHARRDCVAGEHAIPVGRADDCELKTSFRGSKSSSEVQANAFEPPAGIPRRHFLKIGVG